jgi:hypothetical protein
MRIRATQLALVAIALVACAPAVDVRVAGWPVEGLVDCAQLSARPKTSCDRILELARAEVGDAHTDLSVLPPTIYHLDRVNNAKHEVFARSGGGREYVVVFGEGERAVAVGVWCGAGVEPDICGVFQDGPPF